MQFDVVGHDYRVRDYTIEAVDSPTIVGVELDCKFPAYMVDEKLGAWTPRTIQWTNSTQLPRGTEVTIRARTNKPLKRVDLYHSDTQETQQLDCTGAADPQQFELPAGPLDANLTLDVTLFDVDDVVTERPYRIFIAAIPDEAPRVDVRLKGIGTAVTPDVMIPAAGKILDDYGVGRSWFDAVITHATVAENEQKDQLLERDFALAKGGQVEAVLDVRELRSQANKVELEPKDKLSLAIRAEDKYALGDGPNIGSGDRYQLDVVTPETLLAMLEAREIGLRRRFEQIVQEMTQARDFLTRVQSPAASASADPGDADRLGDRAGGQARGRKKGRGTGPVPPGASRPTGTSANSQIGARTAGGGGRFPGHPRGTDQQPRRRRGPQAAAEGEDRRPDASHWGNDVPRTGASRRGSGEALVGRSDCEKVRFG